MRGWIILLLVGVTAPCAHAQFATGVERTTGGGATAVAPVIRLAGAIDGMGLPASAAGGSVGSAQRLAPAFWPLLGPLVAGRNIADPAWLEFGRDDPALPGRQPMAALREPDLMAALPLRPSIF